MQNQIEAFRKFNRFYTRQIGLLNQTLLRTDFSLPQARLLFEIAHREECTAADLSQFLGMDPGQVSRLIHAFEEQGILRRVRSTDDSREKFLKLTSKGKKLFSTLNLRSATEAKNLLEKLPEENRERLLHCMRTIQTVLQPEPAGTTILNLRTHRPGDIGWITYRHGELYSAEYGFDETFEALVADILVRFVNKQNRERERLWIAELEGERVGSVMVVDAGENVAQLRLLLVEPWARGQKIGKRLVEECLTFAREKGYEKIKLWTQSNLDQARELYIKNGFHLIEEEPHQSFGHELVAQIWEMSL